MSSPKYVFDVSAIALSHAGTPVSDPALRYLKSAIRGEVIGILPSSAVIGAHHILRKAYHIRRDVASDILGNLQTARQLEWYESISSQLLNASLETTAETNINAWDGYYSQIVRETNADKILTLDDDFERVGGVDYEVLLTESEFTQLDEFIENIGGIRVYDDLV